MNPFTLELTDEQMRRDYHKAVQTKAYECQFHVVVALCIAFLTSLSYFGYTTATESAQVLNAKYRIYADVIRFGVYLAVIIGSYKCDLLRSYGNMFMMNFFSIEITELYILLGETSTLYIR